MISALSLSLFVGSHLDVYLLLVGILVLGLSSSTPQCLYQKYSVGPCELWGRVSGARGSTGRLAKLAGPFASGAVSGS